MHLDPMKERPILFSGEMVRAILDGRKTVTRRVVKPKIVKLLGAICRPKNPGVQAIGEDGILDFWRCPYGQPGDRMWVKENYRLRADQDDKPPREDFWKSGAWYAADGPSSLPSGCGGGAGRLRPSIHMPRWASRLTLEVAGVRVERVQEITEDGGKAEGVEPELTGETDHGPHCDGNECRGECPIQIPVESYREPFRTLWDSINASRGFGWDKNPWVWVVEFRRVGA